MIRQPSNRLDVKRKVTGKGIRELPVTLDKLL